MVLERDWNDKWNCWYSEGQCINKSGIPCKKRTTNRQNTQGSGIANVGTNPDSNRTVKERHEQALVDRKGHSFHTDKCWSDYEYSLEAASAHLELSKERIEEIHFELSHLESIGELTEENRDEYLVEVDSIVANCPSLLVSEARLYYFNVYILYYISYYSKYEQRSCFTG